MSCEGSRLVPLNPGGKPGSAGVSPAAFAPGCRRDAGAPRPGSWVGRGEVRHPAAEYPWSLLSPALSSTPWWRGRLRRSLGASAMKAGITWALGLLAAGVAVAGERELLRDPEFRAGFRTIAPTAGQRVVLGQLAGETAVSTPAWDLDQWHSRFPFTNPPPRFLAGQRQFTNAAKWVTVSNGVVTLGVDSRPEYGDRLRRSPAEPWVHLLVEQALTTTPNLAEVSRLRLRFAAQLTEAETFRPAGYTPDLHAAQFQLVVTLGNTRRDSPGFRDFLWFVAPLYDDRHAQPPRYVNRDFADPSAKLIFNPGTDAFTTNRLRDGGRVVVDRDLRPLLLEALNEAWRLGYLPGSRDPADYRLTTLNLGWEVPGLHRVGLALGQLILTAETP